MTLDELPIVSIETLEAHSARLRNEKEFMGFVGGTFNYLLTKNPALYSIIEAEAGDNPDPTHVRRVAYTVLTLVNDQLSAEKLKRELPNLSQA